MARIFINYRRDDTPGVAGRLFDHLALKYARSELFMDVDAMQPGIDFAKQLDTQVSQCHVLLAVIGPRWLDAHDQAGRRRLDNDKDYVRVELASALKRDIAVIPVLVDGAVMPSEESLSDDLKPLARRHALELRHTRFDADADTIVHALETVVPRSRVPWRWVVPAAVAAAGIAAIAVFGPKLIAKLRAPPPQIQLSANPAAPTQPAVSSPTAAKPAAPAQQPASPVQPAAPSPAGSASTAGLPAGIKLGEMLHGINLLGTNFRVVEIDQDDPANCQTVCRAETHCAAWTYVTPRASGQPGHCLLKAVIPEQFPNGCCTSAVERAPDPELRTPPPVPVTIVGALSGIDLYGSDYRSFSGPQATPEACQAACRAEGPCLAWTYIRPGVMSSDARCSLKSKIPTEVHNTCCISGIERQVAANPAPAIAAPAVGTGPLLNTNLRGSDYRNLELSSDNWTLCQNACKADNQCLAWTSVHPGPQGPNARCWLKNSIPQPTANSCCTSGIERAEAK